MDEIETEAPAQENTEEVRDEAPAVVSSGIEKRRSRWHTSYLAIQHISASVMDPQVKVRQADRVTSYMLVCCLLFGVLYILFPEYDSSIEVIGSVFAGVALVFYISQRLGILTICTPRQTVLLTELMLGTLLLGIYIAANYFAFADFVKSLFESMK